MNRGEPLVRGRVACGRAAVGAALLALTFLLAGCQAPRPAPPPGSLFDPTSRRARQVAADAAERQTADAVYRGELQRQRQAGALNADPALTRRVRDAASRLVAAVPALHPDAAAWPWDVNLVQANVFDVRALAGGKVLVRIAAGAQPDLDDDELAAVLAHEIVHLLRGHPAERAPLRPGAAGEAVERYLRVHESEADRLGVELAARAGFDPRATASFWKKMSALSNGAAAPAWLVAHPWSEARARDLPAFVSRAVPLYETARANR